MIPGLDQQQHSNSVSACLSIRERLLLTAALIWTMEHCISHYKLQFFANGTGKERISDSVYYCNDLSRCVHPPESEHRVARCGRAGPPE
jgi:hypothetical protein